MDKSTKISVNDSGLETSVDEVTPQIDEHVMDSVVSETGVRQATSELFTEGKKETNHPILSTEEIRSHRKEKGWDSGDEGYVFEYALDETVIRLSFPYQPEKHPLMTEREQLIINALLLQRRVAKQFKCSDPYTTLRLVQEGGGTMMHNASDLFDLDAITRDRVLQHAEMSTADKALYIAGHMFHEQLHEPSDSTKKEALGGNLSVGEVTTITGQICLYLSQGYFGDFGYDDDRVNAGIQKIHNSDKPWREYRYDYDVSTAIGSTFVLKRLYEQFPNISSEGIDTLDTISACKQLSQNIPQGENKSLLEALRRALADSADEEKIHACFDEIRAKKHQSN